MLGQVRPRTAAVIAVSLAVHLALLAWLGLVRGGLNAPYAEPPAIQLDIRPVFVPRPKDAPVAPVSTRPLVARQSRLAPHESPVAPVVIATEPPRAPSPTTPAPPSLRDLLGPRLNCNDLTRLTPEQRERCAERFARGRSADDPPSPLALPPDKKAEYDRQAAWNARKIRRREGDPFQGNAAKWDHEDAIGDVYVSGSGQEGILGGPKPEAPPTSTAGRRTGRLPP